MSADLILSPSKSLTAVNHSSTALESPIREVLWGTRVSPPTDSELNRKIAGTIKAWRNRSIEGEHPHDFPEGIWLTQSRGDAYAARVRAREVVRPTSRFFTITRSREPSTRKPHVRIFAGGGNRKVGPYRDL